MCDDVLCVIMKAPTISVISKSSMIYTACFPEKDTFLSPADPASKKWE